MAVILALTVPAADGRAQVQPAEQKLTSLAGAWTLNRNPAASQPPTPEGRGPGGNRRGPGGFGGPIGGGFGVPTGRGSREQVALQREALRDITDPPTHLVITVTNTMVILIGPDGRTTRLSPDGTKIKDDNTKIERKTRWTAGKLVTEIEGLGPKITQTYSVDAERRQLRLTAEVEGGRPSEARSVTHVYDADER
ncbi:MAG: hypothetical protein WBD07_02215 [Vicinamibacterales bacterium]